MPDSLRTRIVAALSDALVADNSILTVQYGSGSTSNIVVNCNALADAVIRELGLKRASRPSDYGHVNYPPGYQYITDWIADEIQ